MSLVGIIANPDSGRDIRRVVSLAAPVGNQQKINVLRRLLQALSRLGVSRVEIMPDLFGLGRQAMDALADGGAGGTSAALIDMPIEGGAQASLRAPIFEDKVVNFILEMATVIEREITK